MLLRRLVIIAVLTCLAGAWALAQPPLTLRATGRWRLRLSSQELVGGAGTGFAASYESTPDEIRLTIRNTQGPTAPWRVDVRRADTNWDGALTLSVRRTSDGTGDGSISDGTAYQAVTTSDAVFFDGTGDRQKIDLQLKIDGDLNSLFVDDYVTTVFYTLTET